MAAASMADIKTRIAVLMAAIPGITRVFTSDNCKLADTDLPAVIFGAGDGTRERVTADSLRVTREFQIVIYVQRVCKPDSYDDQASALGVAEAWLDSVPDYFAKRKRLELDGVPLNIHDTTLLVDSGALILPFRADQFGAVFFSFNVITLRTIR